MKFMLALEMSRAIFLRAFERGFAGRVIELSHHSGAGIWAHLAKQNLGRWIRPFRPVVRELRMECAPVCAGGQAGFYS